MESDAAVIERCRSGQTDAFRTLVERYQTEAFGHALAILEHRDDALDAVQEAFWDAFVALDRFDTSRDFYPWFYVILRHRCLKQLKSRQRQPKVRSEDMTRLSLVGPDTTSVARELDEALWSLRPEDREIITWKHLDGLSYADLAESLEIPIGTVMSRLYHARRRLREHLESDEGCDP